MVVDARGCHVRADERREDYEHVDKVERLEAVALLVPYERHARERAAREDDRVEPKLRPDPAALLDAHLWQLEDERRDGEEEVPADGNRHKERRLKAHVVEWPERHAERAIHEMEEAWYAEHLVHVEDVLVREETALNGGGGTPSLREKNA